MRLDRVSLQLADGEVRTFEFHRGLTVVEAEAGSEDALARALLGTLSAAADGVHVEFTLDDGRSHVAFRPFGAPHRVIDVDSSEDRTSTFARPDGRVDVLGPLGDGSRQARPDLVVSREDLTEGDPTEAWVARLADADVDAVLATAEAEVAAEQDLRRATAGGRQSPDADQTAAAPDAKARAAERRYRILLPTTAVVGAGLAIGAAAGVDTLGTAGSLALIGGSLGLVAGTLLYGRKVSAITNRTATGIDGQPGSAADALAVAAGRYQQASEAWTSLAGTVPAPWVLSERERIARTAQLRHQGNAGQTGPQPLATAPASSAVIAGLTVRMASSYASGPAAEALPLFLDDPLEGLAWAEKAPVLEFLGRLATSHQLVLVTADPEILSWARLEAMAGSVGAITSSGDGDATGDDAGSAGSAAAGPPAAAPDNAAAHSA